MIVSLQPYDRSKQVIYLCNVTEYCKSAFTSISTGRRIESHRLICSTGRCYHYPYSDYFVSDVVLEKEDRWAND